jgi:transcriptional regulator with XRE-family HTH domain
MSITGQEIGQKLEKLFQEKGKNQSGAALYGEFSKSTITNWKNGKMPRIDNLAAVCQYLGISIDELVFGKSPVPGLSPEALEIARAADKLNAEGKRIILFQTKTLEQMYPLGILESTKTAI